MDFDEFEYLEQTEENSESRKSKQTANGGKGRLKSKDKDQSRTSTHKSDVKDDKFDQNLTKLLSGDDSCEDDTQNENGSTGRHSRSREKEKGRHRSSRDLKGRERDREGDRKRRSGDRDRKQEHDRGGDRRERANESERERDRDCSKRSRSHSERLRSDRDERQRERSRDRERSREIREKEYGGREKDRALPEPVTDSRRHKEKKEEVAKPEVEPDSDKRTVFAYQLPLKADERDLYEFFTRAGKVRDVKLITDRSSRRSRGVGYIEFCNVMSVPKAIALSGLPLLGQPVMVKPSEAEKNLVQSTTLTSGACYSGFARRLYVGNLLYNMTETGLRKVFEAFGEVELVQLPLDEAGLCKGFGFVQYVNIEDARNALTLNGNLDIGGNTIKVSVVNDHSGTTQEVDRNTDDFDEEGGGLVSGKSPIDAINASSRAILMQTLACSGTASSAAGYLGTPVTTGINPLTMPFLGAAPLASPPAQPASVPGLAGLSGAPVATGSTVNLDTLGIPSECLLLKNMFDPKEEKEPDFDLDVKEDVIDESSRFGNLRHIFVDKNTAGHVYLRFDNTQSAIGAQRALHGRWFAGKMITATFMVPQIYEAKFPDS